MPRDTDLHKAAYKGNANAVREFIDSGEIDVNEAGAANRTALHRAVAANSVEVVSLLIEKGARVDVTDKSGRTPLHWAAVVDATRCANVLVSNGADINAVSSTGSTPLHMACDLGKQKFVQYALSAGGDVQAEDKAGMKPYDLAKLNNHKEVAKLVKPGGKSGSDVGCGCFGF